MACPSMVCDALSSPRLDNSDEEIGTVGDAIVEACHGNDLAIDHCGQAQLARDEPPYERWRRPRRRGPLTAEEAALGPQNADECFDRPHDARVFGGDHKDVRPHGRSVHEVDADRRMCR